MMDNLIGATLFFSSYFGVGLACYFLTLKFSSHSVAYLKYYRVLIILGWPVIGLINACEGVCKLVEKMAGK